MRHTFKVKKTKNDREHAFTVEMPKTLADTALIEKRYGSVERLVDRANAQWTVSVANGIRKRLPDLAKAEAYAEHYRDDGRKDVFVREVVVDLNDPDAPEYTPEQIAHLQAKGLKFA